jgi:hypothetical protein
VSEGTPRASGGWPVAVAVSRNCGKGTGVTHLAKHGGRHVLNIKTRQRTEGDGEGADRGEGGEGEGEGRGKGGIQRALKFHFIKQRGARWSISEPDVNWNPVKRSPIHCLPHHPRVIDAGLALAGYG